MGITDFLFGGSEDAKHVGNAPLLTGPQKDTLNQLIQMVQGQVGQGVDPYPGQIAPGASDIQDTTFQFLQNLLSGGDTGMAAGTDALTQLLRPFDPAATTEAWEAGVKAPALQTWEEEILPAIQERYIGQGAASSGAANRAITKSGADLSADLAGQLATMLLGQEGQHEATQLAAVDQMLRQALGLTGVGLTAGGQQRDIMAELLGEDYQKWQTAQPYNNPWLQMLQTVLGTKAFDPIVQGPTQSRGVFGDLLGAASNLGAGAITAGGWGGLFG